MKKLLAVLALLAVAISPHVHAQTSARNATFGSPNAMFMGTMPSNGGVVLNTCVLTNQNDGCAATTTTTKAATITKVCFRQVSVTGTPTTNGHTVSLQTLTTGGAPSGTTVGSVAGTTFTPASAENGTVKCVTLGSTYTVTAGQQVAIVLQRTTAAADSSVYTINDSHSQYGLGWPLAQKATAGTWAHVITGYPLIVMKSASETFGFVYAATGTQRAFGNTLEAAATFTIPSTMCATYKLRGVRALMLSPDTSPTDTLVATTYSSPTSSPARIDQSIAIPADRFGGAGGQSYRPFEFYFTSQTTMNGGTKYAVAFGAAASFSQALYSLDVTDPTDFDGWDYKQLVAYTSRTASSYAGILAGTATGNFAADTTTSRPWIELILDTCDPPAGGGGGAAGFMRLN